MIRLATAADASLLAALRRRWRTEEANEPADETFDERLLEWLTPRLESTHVAAVALDDTVGVGMGFLAVLERVPSPAAFPRLAGAVQSVYVVPERRNVGLGASIVRLLVDEAGRRGLDYLMVHPSAPSFSLYRRLGFSDSGRVLELDLRRR